MWRALAFLAALLAVCGLGFALAATEEVAVRVHVDGPPPPIPHDDFTFACTKCHTPEGKEMRGMGAIPALPHRDPRTLDRCEMCHVYQRDAADFAGSGFIPFQARPYVPVKDPKGRPPVVPHRLVLRENCAACHAGEGRAGAPVTSHPERTNCVQCHVVQVGSGAFSR